MNIVKKTVVALLGTIFFTLVTACPTMANDHPSDFFKVKIGVSDFEKAVSFYSVFGLIKGRRYNPKELGLEWSGGDLARVTNIILTDPDIVNPGSGFLIFFVADISKTKKQLIDRGFNTVKEIEPNRILLVEDFDGNRVEVVQGDPATPFKVKIGVNDFEKALSFYSLFDLELGVEYNEPAIGHVAWGLNWVQPPLAGLNNVILMDAETIKPGNGFILKIVSDTASVKKRLIANGFVNIRELADGRLLLVDDPDGNTVELVQRKAPDAN